MSRLDMFAYPTEQAGPALGFLSGLHEDDVAVVLTYTQTQRFAAMEVAMRRGERDQGLYVVTHGEFEILVDGPRGPRRIRTLRVGDLFGELAFFDNEPRSADVRATVDAEVLVMTAHDFERLRTARPHLALAVVLDLGRVLSLRFREHDRRLAALEGR